MQVELGKDWENILRVELLSLKLTAKRPENGCLEDDPFLEAYFEVLC